MRKIYTRIYKNLFHDILHPINTCSSKIRSARKTCEKPLAKYFQDTIGTRAAGRLIGKVERRSG